MDTDGKIRAEINKVMRVQDVNQTDLARKLGVKPQSVYSVLRGARGKQPQSLIDILDALGLELTVQPKPEPPAPPPVEDEAALLESGLADFADALDELESDVPEAERKAWLESFMGVAQ